jgi:S-adenosyl-L-methionine hydrolase (adenosine-forming)
MAGLITLTTDFGLRDGYVAAMKGAILTIAPEVRLVDVSHKIAPQDVVAAAFALASAAPYFPQGAVHLLVVDPGVGSQRRMLAVRTARACYVAPDNGALALALRQDPPQEIVSLTERRYWRAGEISHTFHGRDIMGPVAAHLANGVPLGALGEPASDVEPLPLPELRPTRNGGLVGAVIHVDRFGNLISNIPAGLLPPRACAAVGAMRPQPLLRSYAEAATGQPLVLVGSHGYLEIAVREGNASQLLGVGRGATVTVTQQYLV